MPTTGCIHFRNVETPLSVYKPIVLEGEGDVACHLSLATQLNATRRGLYGIKIIKFKRIDYLYGVFRVQGRQTVHFGKYEQMARFTYHFFGTLAVIPAAQITRCTVLRNAINKKKINNNANYCPTRTRFTYPKNLVVRKTYDVLIVDH